jgi:hypothetical protein
MPQPKNLFEQMMQTLEKGWCKIFPTWKGHALAVEFAMDLITSTAPQKTIAAILEAAGKGQCNHKPYYELFSDSPWKAEDLFQPVIAQSAAGCLEGVSASQPWLPVAIDDTLMKKFSAKIPGVATARDPESLPFHTNLVRGVRVLQASAVIPHYTTHGGVGARAYPVASRITPPVQKPGKNATKEEIAQWKQEKKENNLNTAAREMCADLRARYDLAGFAHARLLALVDASFCNATMMKEPMERVELLARCRKDARLCHRAPAGSRSTYDHATAFTPEQLRKSSDHKWIRIRIFYGGKWRKAHVKVVRNILWQKASGTRPLTLIVIRPRPFRPSAKAKLYLKDPAYLLTTATDICLTYAVRAYFCRWGIEDNFRDEKSIVGVNDAQVRCPQSVERYIPFATAVYSLMLLTCWKELGPTRTSDYHRPPRWRSRPQTRPSARDMIKLLQTHREQLRQQEGTSSFRQKQIALRSAKSSLRHSTQQAVPMA